jgi:hypothetical protein
MARLVIETARNGFVVRYREGRSESEMVTTIAQDDSADATFALLGEVLDRVGEIGSRYDARRVRILIEPGDKWTPKAGEVCLHENVRRWSYGGEVGWSCPCGAKFGLLPS